jgi:hypothetical protein
MVVVLVPQTSTRHSSLSGATTNDERLSPTNLTFSCDFTTMLKKLIYVRHPAVSYGWTILNRTKVKSLVVHPVINLQKGHFKISVGHACTLQIERCMLRNKSCKSNVVKESFKNVKFFYVHSIIPYGIIFGVTPLIVLQYSECQPPQKKIKNYN